MGVERLEDLAAFQLAVEFKLAVYPLVRNSPGASRDHQYRNQLFGAVTSVEMNIAEGWGRATTSEMMVFLRYARGSLYEARRHLLDGVSRGYFQASECERALTCANRCAGATTNLWKSLEPFAKSKFTRGSGKPRP